MFRCGWDLSLCLLCTLIGKPFCNDRVNKKSNIKGQTQKLTVTLDDGDDEGLARLIPDIQETSELVQRCTRAFLSSEGVDQMDDGEYDADRAAAAAIQRNKLRTLEQRYIDVMKELQFGECFVNNATTSPNI